MTGYNRSAPRPVDSQKSRCYRWGHKIAALPEIQNNPDLKCVPKRMMQALVNHVCDEFEVFPPDVKFNNRKKNWAHYHPNGHYIELPGNTGSWAHNIETVLHETAHAIHEKLCSGNDLDKSRSYHASHGPAFITIFIWLMSTHTELDHQELTQSAFKAGLRVGSVMDLLGD